MRVIILATISILCLNIFSNAYDGNDIFLTKETLAYRKTQASFQTYSYDEHPFKNWTMREVKRIMGVREEDVTVDMDTSLDIGDDSHFPESFDARTKWPDCIHPIRNQGNCGSCWALAGTSVFSDRICITSKNKINVNLSAEDSLECNFSNYGCNGGNLMSTWRYFSFMGSVTEECNPYSADDGSINRCKYRKNCVKKEILPKKYLTKSEIFPIKKLTTVELIKKDIMLYGPVQSAFQVFEDFMDYKAGIYTHSTGRYLGGHAVKIVGWDYDRDNGIIYWIVANTWGDNWGEKGYFRIQMGQCGIEKNAISLLPELS
jgi:cathepsin B